MASLNMNGPYQFDYATIGRFVAVNRIGNYALGHMADDNKTFIVEYVGRSDTDVAWRLHTHLPDCYSSKFLSDCYRRCLSGNYRCIMSMIFNERK